MDKTKPNPTPEQIASKIADVRQYFMDKILTKEFKVISKNSFSIEIKIDDRFRFSLWIANGLSHLNTRNDSAGESDFIIHFTDKEKKQLIYSVFKDEMVEVQEKYERAELKRLKAKYEPKTT